VKVLDNNPRPRPRIGRGQCGARVDRVSHLGTLGVTWPVAVDNDFALWKAYNIEVWPTQMIFDRRGKSGRVVVGDSQDSTVDATINAWLRETG
jgi:hypothetical protein